MKITYYAAASLDGYIAREDGDVSWLDTLDIDPADTGYEAFFASTDGLVMGRNTYDFVFNYGSWPYGNKPTWVCTSRALETLDGANLLIEKTIKDIIPAAAAMELKHLWLVGGGELASSLLDEGLLTHLSISEMPVRLNNGIPLFARHRLENLTSGKHETIRKSGFNQLEMTLK